MNNSSKIKNILIHSIITVFLCSCFICIQIFLTPLFKFSGIFFITFISTVYIAYIIINNFISKIKNIKRESLKIDNILALIINFLDNEIDLFKSYFLNQQEFKNIKLEYEEDITNIEKNKVEIINYLKNAAQKYDFNKLNSDNKIEIDRYIKKLFSLLEDLQRLEKNVFINLLNNENINTENKHTKHFLLEYKFLSELNMDFLESISSNVTNATEPLTNEIFEIKKNISEFINKIIKWDKELENEDSNLNYNNVLKRYEMLINALNELVTRIENYHNYLSNNLGTLKKKVDNIYSQTGQIDEIAAKIKILALNASIEAARAGDKGSGFKIIAVETQKLSDSTQALLKTITENIKEAETIVKNTNDQVNINCMETKNVLGFQKNESVSFHEILSKYYKNYISACNGIQEVSDKINFHIDKINPVFQTHDIIVQQANNISEIINKINKIQDDYINTEIENIEPEEKNKVLKETVHIIENQITTDDEVTNLGMQAEKYNIDVNTKIIKGDSDIEFF